MKLLISLVLLACAACPALAQVRSLIYKEEKRRYLVYTPPSYGQQADKAFPVVFNFHGSGMTMGEQMLYTQMNRAADRHQFIVVYPAGIKQDWNVGFGMDYLGGTDDIGFIEGLLARVKQDYRIDTQRIYATGLSRGGFFTQRIAAELPHLFAAVASVGGPIPQPVVEHHAKPGKIGILLLHGTADKVVNFAGKPGDYLSVQATYDYWLKRNGIGTASTSHRLIGSNAADGTQVDWQEQGDGRHSVALATIREGGHTWPGADPFNLGLPMGKTTGVIEANEVIWHFFEKHHL